MLSVLKTDKSPGPDRIHAVFIHNTAEEVANVKIPNWLKVFRN